MDSVYIVMPAYNEEENIEEVVASWYLQLEGKGEASRLVVADSGSSDSTHEILVRLQEKLPKLVVLSDTDKQHGPKLMVMYQYAISQGADYVFQTDSDGHTNPEEFGDFWEERIRYDVTLGERKQRGDGKQRAFVEKVVCILLKLFFKVTVPDANAPFRLMKTEVMKKYLGKLPEKYALPNIMLTVYFVHGNEKVQFKDITFRARQGGVNSMNIKKIVKIGCQSLKDFYGFRKEMFS